MNQTTGTQDSSRPMSASPLGTRASDPWKTCFDKSKAFDDGRIKLWRDEVDKVLLFVGGPWIDTVHAY